MCCWIQFACILLRIFASMFISDESESRSVMSNSWQPHGLHGPWNSRGQNTGVGSLSLLQGIFLIQGSNPGLPYCRCILYQLSHKGCPRMEWVAYSISSGSSPPRNWTGVSCIAGGFFTSWAMREAVLHRCPSKSPSQSPHPVCQQSSAFLAPRIDCMRTMFS